MSLFRDAARPADFARDVEERATPRVSLLVIVGLTALSWALLAGIVMAVRAVL